MTTDVSKVLLVSAARTANNNSAEISNVKTRGRVDFILDVTAHAGTTPTLDVIITGRDPGGQSWVQLVDDAGVLLAFAQVLEVDGSERITLPQGLADTNIRVESTITGTTPSYTYSVSMVAKDD